MAPKKNDLSAGLRLAADATRRYDLAGHTETGLLSSRDAATRAAASKINAKRDILTHPRRAVKAAELRALVTLDAVFRRLSHELDIIDAKVFERAWLKAESEMGQARSRTVRGRTCRLYDTKLTDEEIALERLLSYVLGENKAAERMWDLVVLDPVPEADQAILSTLESAKRLPGFDESLAELMLEVARRHPDSLLDQLDYVARKFKDVLGSDLLANLLRTRDLLAEASKFGGHTGPTRSEVYEFNPYEVERFSPDAEWMPNCVIIARNTFVWLHQLSKRYGRQIERLDQIPDQEFETLSKNGINGLWLIGLWERSDASRRIKQMCGSDHAVASAYSLYDYVIAHELGGEAAFEKLKSQAWRHGVRLAADMVPNHVGVVSKWVIDDPDWFLSLPESPFPSYTFNGPDLCDAGHVSIHIEDKYYTREDAAVVFKRYDHETGDTRYIYHGNDGTSMPWNDTAQIDYLNPEAREAVIQTILHVARKFPVIRFDAAMTLVNKHIQRLWYPEPGSAGAIPSRARHGMSREDFARRMPTEFWAEVVDRVAEEAPDTLLLAEAFWMLEGYFVRSLGMHRVYNSAFMNMLRDEDNAGYRKIMKNTLEFDPQILKRYVNFMNNPDEETAEAQFGKGDKYFGVATMMATLPGLPMFGHGQIEGFTEKYGMDFRKPMLDETPDAGLVAYHEQRIFPLLHRRWLFAEVDNFRLYDLFTVHGVVDENVFAYSNQRGDARALVVYHNRFANTQGWIRTSVGYAQKTNDENVIKTVDLAGGLSLRRDENIFYRFRDQVSGLEYLRSAQALSNEGFYVELDGYTCHVFVDWDEIQDLDGRWRRLANHLAGRPVPSLEEAWQRLEYGGIYAALLAVLEADSPAGRKAAFAALAMRVEERVEEVDAQRAEEAFADALDRLHKDASFVAHDLVIMREAFLALGEDPRSARELFAEWAVSMGLADRLGSFGGGVFKAVLDLDDMGREKSVSAAEWLMSTDVQDALGVHEFEGKRWFTKEAFDAFIKDFPIVHASDKAQKIAHKIREEALALEKFAEDTAYDFDRLVRKVRGEGDEEKVSSASPEDQEE